MLAAAWIVQFRRQLAYRTVTTVTSTSDSILLEIHYASATGISPLKSEQVKSSPMAPLHWFCLASVTFQPMEVISVRTMRAGLVEFT